MFDCGDKVIYPGHGVAIIESIVEKSIAGCVSSFVKLEFVYKDMTILVPTYNVKTLGIRFPSSEKEILLAIEIFFQKPKKVFESSDFTPSGWNRRQKEYQSKIQSGLLQEIAKIYRDLMYISQQKDLSFGEKSLLQTTEELLSQEIQVVKSLDREVVIQYLRSPFKQFMSNYKPIVRENTS
jgi:CarD family transcriptional regulator